MDEKSYADLVALCQFLPGPASSQVGIGIGVMRAGVLGGIISFLGFTLPSVIALILFALILQRFDIGDAGWVHGLKIVAVAIVAHAILGMAQKLTPDLKRKAIALFALVGTLLWQTTLLRLESLSFLPSLASFFLNTILKVMIHKYDFPISHRFAVICLSLFFGYLSSYLFSRNNLFELDCDV